MKIPPPSSSFRTRSKTVCRARNTSTALPAKREGKRPVFCALYPSRKGFHTNAPATAVWNPAVRVLPFHRKNKSCFRSILCHCIYQYPRPDTRSHRRSTARRLSTLPVLLSRFSAKALNICPDRSESFLSQIPPLPDRKASADTAAGIPPVKFQTAFPDLPLKTAPGCSSTSAQAAESARSGFPSHSCSPASGQCLSHSVKEHTPPKQRLPKALPFSGCFSVPEKTGSAETIQGRSLHCCGKLP